MNSPFDEAKYTAMLEGLEINEVSLDTAMSTPDFRIDAEFYKRLPAESAAYEYSTIGSILKSAQYGISIAMNEEGQGYPIYRMNEMTDMLCNAEVDKYADVSYEEMLPFALTDGDVLFNRTNSQKFVGRTGVYKTFAAGQERIFASYLIRLVPNPEKILPEYLTTFLNTKYGVDDVKRRARISINQSNVNAEEVKAVRIPLLSKAIQQRIAEQFTHSHAKIIASQQACARAETLLLRALDLENWQPPLPLTYESTAQSAFTAGRLDAEHFQPKYDTLMAHVKHHAAYWRTVDDIATFCDRGVQPLYSEDGPLPVVNSRHILEAGLDYDNFERTDPNLYVVKADTTPALIGRGDILTYTTGAKIGRTAVYLEYAPALASNHVNITRVTENAVYVGVALNSMIGRMQTRQNCAGSAQVEIYPGDIKRFVVPFVDDATQAAIAWAVEDAHTARRTAKRLLEIAKRAVEVAIEDSEAAGLALLGAGI